jgi:hypothetical protein
MKFRPWPWAVPKKNLRYLAAGRAPDDNPESPPKQQGETRSKQAANPNQNIS